MANAAFIGDEKLLREVYSGGRWERVAGEFELLDGVIGAHDVRPGLAAFADVAYLFSTWGMPPLDRQQIACFPALRGVFYAAGSVQNFARPFLDAGVVVVSAWAANAIPVAEYTLAQILLGMKGFFHAARAARRPDTRSSFRKEDFPGIFDAEVSLLGAGMIGRAVIERLKPYQLRVLVFDPFLSEADALRLGVEKVTLEDAFARATVVSNHLANRPATVRMLRRELFASMKPYASFINTGRGATVDEAGMIGVLRERRDLNAVLDVTNPEPPEPGSELYTLDNVILTPHIAGAQSREVRRMADYAIDEALAFRAGRPLTYAVTHKMLETMA